MSPALRQYIDFLIEFQESQLKSGLAPARWLSNHGRMFEFGPESFKGRRMRERDCYRNAALKAIGNHELIYVEGFVEAILPIEHAWLINKDGYVIEPTLRNDNGRVNGYFGVPIKTDYLCRTLAREKVYGVFGYWNWKRVLTDNPDEIIAKSEGE